MTFVLWGIKDLITTFATKYVRFNKIYIYIYHAVLPHLPQFSPVSNTTLEWAVVTHSFNKHFLNTNCVLGLSGLEGKGIFGSLV